jgi:hypothetical protein
VPGTAEERGHVGDLDDSPRVHHRDAVGAAGDVAEVVRDEDDGHADLFAQAVDEFEDLFPDGHVHGGCVGPLEPIFILNPFSPGTGDPPGPIGHTAERT